MVCRVQLHGCALSRERQVEASRDGADVVFVMLLWQA